MKRTHRIFWNATTQTWRTTADFSKGDGKKAAAAKSLAASLLMTAGVAFDAHASASTKHARHATDEATVAAIAPDAHASAKNATPVTAPVDAPYGVTFGTHAIVSARTLAPAAAATSNAAPQGAVFTACGEPDCG